ncbi:MAG: 6-bladed beta-propeller, partial [Coriobacteriia bacterium]|nr:6-bladed beta-propeller [Coriobacteriia bacterium]
MLFFKKRVRWTSFLLGMLVLAQSVLLAPVPATAIFPSTADSYAWEANSAGGRGGYPEALALAGDNTLLVTETDYAVTEFPEDSVLNGIAKYNLAQSLTTPSAVYGTTGNTTNPPQFLWPAGIAVDSTGRIVVADSWNDRIMVLAADGTFDSTFGSYGEGTGGYEFACPLDIAVDTSDNIYVSDSDNGRIQVYSSSGTYQGLYWNLPKPGSQIPWPDGIEIGPDGYLYVVDGVYHKLYKYSTSGGAPLATVGTFGNADTFDGPQGLAIDSDGTVYVADTQNSRIVRFDSNLAYIDTVGTYGSGPGQFQSPEDLTIDSDGNLYIADTLNDRVQKLKITPAAPDTVPPVTTSNISPNWVKNDVSVALTATDASSTVTGTYCTADGTTPTSATPYTAPFQVTAEGITTVKYYSVDRPGNAEAIKTQYVKLDKTAPTTSSNATTTPYYGSATVQLTPADSLSGVQETWYWWNAGAPQFGTTAIMSVLGTHNLYWYSTDHAGNSQTLQHAVIVVEPVDDNPPVTTPNFSDQTWFNTSFQVTLNAIDAVTTVAATYYSTDGSPPVTMYTAPFTVTAEGITPVKYYSVDSRGNTELTNTRGLKIDKTPPTTTSDAQDSYIGTATVTISTTDHWAGGPPDVSGVQRIQYKLDGDIWRDYVGPIQVTGEILHTLYYKSIDFAGNEENAQLKLISILPIDNRPPVTDSNIPSGWTKGPFYINLYAEDDVTGVAATFYYLSSEEETPTLYEGPILVSEPGVYTVRFFSVDNRGNVESVRERVLQL